MSASAESSTRDADGFRATPVDADTFGIDTFHKTIAKQHLIFASEPRDVVVLESVEVMPDVLAAYFDGRYQAAIKAVRSKTAEMGVGTVICHFAIKGELADAAAQPVWNALWQDGGALDKIHGRHARRMKRVSDGYPVFVASSHTHKATGDRLTLCTAASLFIVRK